MAEEKKKTGFFAAIKESMTKSGGCCGGRETWGCTRAHSEEKDTEKTPPK